ncbi:MAG: SpaA isopeptide-forming pilin-related protein, partial [Chloroflexota bacterium]|nr:SpaA isopeptide-forming pilin-related protein [Chloroflexota bacterium]
TLNRDNEALGPFCTGDDPDGAAGEVIVDDLPAGVYEAVAEPAADAAEPDQVAAAQRVRERRTFTIRGGEAPPRVVFTFQRQPATTGDLLIIVRNEQNMALDGACFGVYEEGEQAIAEICDGDRADRDGNPGRVRFDDLEAGSYRLSQLVAPPGYDLVQDQLVEIVANEITRVRITNVLLPATDTVLTVQTVTDSGEPLLGACYSLQRGASTVGPVCGDDANSGIATFTELQGGAYLLRQTQPPAGYDRASTQALLIPAGETSAVEVVHIARPGSVEIVKVDNNGDLLAGSCFVLLTGDNQIVYRTCDNEQNDADPEPGVLLMTGIAAGEYVVREARPPAGYQRAADQTVSVQSNRRAFLEFENLLLPPPPQRGDLTIFKIGPDDRPLPGACFALLQDDAVVFGPRCDGDDGANDGTISFIGAGVGEFTLSETRAPSGNYLPIQDTAVTIQLNQNTELIVENQFRPGRILIRKIDQNRIPLQNACFVLEPSDGTPLCTDVAGNALFANLQPGTYRLVETQQPLGYLPVDPVAGIVVNPGATTTLDVVNQLAPPPPNTGSVQVVKFYCPAGDDGEGTVFIDSSNPGASQLAQTANCTAGDARFSLISTSGEGGPGQFSTGNDGRYQTTLLAGNYNLNELDPNLPGNTTEEVRIFVNQLTTVVVLNYVAPPAPSPALVDVIKYTCAPGFQGTIFLDFAEGCVADQNLTNNVTFRLAGETTARRITGDLGQQGVTRFDGLGPGIYTLREEPPAANLTVYAFCGLDPNNPELRQVGDSIQMRLSAGQQVTCTWFNVPDDLSPTTGSIVIHKYGCAATTYPPGYDWFRECESQGAGVQFALSFFDGTQFVPRSTGATSEDGLLRFNRVPPGTYRLQEIGAAWCHAESDSVNAQGDVIVQAGQRANVWIFNCLGTKQPPNTGAGPLAGLPAPDGLLALAPRVAWPGLGFAAYAAYRQLFAP